MGIIFNKYRSGINLGGWVSQCSMEKEHIKTFIKKEDIKKIASWGLDHIRLPFDYPILEDDNNPFHYKEDGFEIIDNLLCWCKEYSLNLIIDMHMAPGYAFYNDANDNVLFSDENVQKRFISIWQELAKRYIKERDNIIFELLNEIVDAHGAVWNNNARKTIEGIRSIDDKRYILLGGANYNSVNELNNLEIYDDDHIIYNFHFYEPFLFTHQRAGWTPLKNIDINQPYPGKIEGMEKLKEYFKDKKPDQGKSMTPDIIFDKNFLLHMISPAVKFAEQTKKELYCGEYGAIELADLESRIKYMFDINEIFEQNKFGRALWSYKGMNFSTIDENGNSISKDFVKAMSVK